MCQKLIGNDFETDRPVIGADLRGTIMVAWAALMSVK